MLLSQLVTLLAAQKERNTKNIKNFAHKPHENMVENVSESPKKRKSIFWRLVTFHYPRTHTIILEDFHSFGIFLSVRFLTFFFFFCLTAVEICAYPSPSPLPSKKNY